MTFFAIALPPTSSLAKSLVGEMDKQKMDPLKLTIQSRARRGYDS